MGIAPLRPGLPRFILQTVPFQIWPKDPVALNFRKLCQPREPFFRDFPLLQGGQEGTMEVSRDELPANDFTLD